jgi:hypothetical protein
MVMAGAKAPPSVGREITQDLFSTMTPGVSGKAALARPLPDMAAPLIVGKQGSRNFTDVIGIVEDKMLIRVELSADPESLIVIRRSVHDHGTATRHGFEDTFV